ncbi:MAG: hypothetical protein GTO53_09990, partial [Planctomycetales bacterium]|nr:hypothetical protein [Planctomycetales bacterium]NIM09450.1 hypothetical protein [Planctomycetales bacterium]NIN08932.1 hypothetical protein [Planctomycetales bacterium]NIN78053.1 hypothetical protein [Planctomycetales bacterium]NIO35231.1 hypothetical protein [Planctomycetales bacterium]
MATYPTPDTLAREPFLGAAPAESLVGVFRVALAPLASLRLTVVLFSLAIGIVMIGTLAQIEMDMWSVMSHYFYCWLAWVPVRIFFPPAWYPDLPAENMRVLFAFLTVLVSPLAALLVHQLLRPSRAAGPLAVLTLAMGLVAATTAITHGAFLFPGGKAIGLAMVCNLLAAHAVRFTVQARGARFTSGVLVMAAGILATWYVVVSGHNPAGLQGVPFFEQWTHLWVAIKVALVASVAAAVAATIYFAWQGHLRRVEFWIFATLLLPLVGLAVWLIWPGNDAYLGHAGMRILWQLIKAEFAALVLLVGCQLLFRRRGGIALLHGGVLLLMFGQVFVSQFDVEEQMTIAEGQTVNYAQDIRAVELAVIDRKLPDDDQQDRVVAIPLASNGKPSRFLATKTIQYDALPFEIEIKQYFPNSKIEPVTAASPNPATKGKGLKLRAEKAKPATGADGDGRVDQASAYLAFTDKQSGADLGTYLLSQAVLVDRNGALSELNETIAVGGKTYDVALRFRRQYKPYSVTLIDVRKDDYLGSSMVKNYSSDIYLVDETRNVDRKPHIWMNNPLRYAGETFYQSRWFVDQAGVENTVFSVVTNRGWMIPYVACMIVATGLLAHFTIVLIRFLNRLSRQAAASTGQLSPAADTVSGVPVGKKRGSKAKAAAASERTSPQRRGNLPTLIIALAVVLLGVFWVWRAARPVQRPATEMQVEQFGQLPVIYRGRVKPIDTLARNSLRAVSNREEYTDGEGKIQGAIRWLLDVITDSPAARQQKVFRIDNLEVLDILGLKRRQGSLYAINEIMPRILKFEREVMKARQKARDAGPETLSVYQKKLVELDGRLRTYTLLSEAFVPPNLPPLPTVEEIQRDQQAAKAKADEFRQAYQQFMTSIRSREAPLVVPQPESAGDTSHVDWLPYSQAWATSFIDAHLLGRPPGEALSMLNT